MKLEMLSNFIRFLCATMKFYLLFIIYYNFAYLQIFNSVPELVVRPQISRPEIGLRQVTESHEIILLQRKKNNTVKYNNIK